MKKQLLLLIFTIGLSINTYAQENEELHILEADSTWLKEIIKFPLGFAQDINYIGYEDLRFAEDWSNFEGLEFFTYAFVWNINLTDVPTVSMIETNMKLYYDGLMTAVNKDNDFTIPNTIVDFNQIENNSEMFVFKGIIQVYDSFFTKEVISLYVDIETTYCKDQNKYLMLFKVSTLSFENIIWEKLQDVTLSLNACEISSI